MIIDGKAIAQGIANEIKTMPGTWREKTFVAFLVGDNKESESFLRQKEAFAKKLGIDFRLYRLSEELSNDKLRKEVGRITKGSKVGGAIVQLPLPDKFNEQTVLNAIDKEKDVDCLSERALGGFYTGRWKVSPPAVGAVERILRGVDYHVSDKKVAILGRGKLIGKPIFVWAASRAREVSVVYLDGESDGGKLMDCDLIISGVGTPHIIKGEFIKKGVGIIDFGYYFDESGVRGDVDMESSGAKAGFVTPTPGGTGPTVVAMVFYNFALLNS